ncbi:hypothetical protein BH20CHL5_BH20CHL5_00650 [soil metagenome]|jgi:hypothetical protein|nr:hypothetical protein [Chloroflexota bacterium]
MARSPARSIGRSLRASFTIAAALLALPSVASAHSLSGTVNSPLPLVAYLAGAAVAVGLSFAFVALTEGGPPKEVAPPRSHRVPRAVQLLLRGLGLTAWLWVAAQALVGGSSDADVASLFLWIYGWVGLAIVSSLVGPLWSWIDPFSTLHDIFVWLGRRLGIGGGAASPVPPGWGVWPAVAGFAFFIWLELAVDLLAGRLLGLVMVGYTLITLAAMAQFGKDSWRAHGEAFSVWFRLLGRLAPFALEGSPDDGRLRRQGFGGGLSTTAWSSAQVVMVAIGTAAIIYDGFSQTQVFFDLVGIPDLVVDTALLSLFLGFLAGVVLLVARAVGTAAMGAGLLPVAAGYLMAHYLTYLLIDGQRIFIALSDPLQQGWDLFGTAFSEPQDAWLSTSAAWSIQLAAVVGGHVVGAWAGHTVAQRTSRVQGRLGQLPLALVMVALTTATLWSLGQNLVFVEDGEVVESARSAPAEPYRSSAPYPPRS